MSSGAPGRQISNSSTIAAVPVVFHHRDFTKIFTHSFIELGINVYIKANAKEIEKITKGFSKMPLSVKLSAWDCLAFSKKLLLASSTVKAAIVVNLAVRFALDDSLILARSCQAPQNG